MTLILAAVLGWPWSIALAAMESDGEPVEIASPVRPIRAVRAPRSAASDSLAATVAQIAETDDEEGPDPGRTVPLYADCGGSRAVEPLILSDASPEPPSPPSGAPLLRSRRLRL